MNNIKFLFLSIIVLFFLSSCGINSNIMFRDIGGKDVITENIPIAPTEEYKLAPNDIITFTLLVNNGKRLLDMQSLALLTEEGAARNDAGTNMQMMMQMGRGNLEYFIRPDKLVELPIIGNVDITNLTIFEAQEKLKELYKPYYNEPFVQLEIMNRRAIVFPGGSGDAVVVPIINNNTTLMEVLGMAGGIPERGRARKVKVMRWTENGRQVYLIDLSTMEGLKYADMIIQANDYIYVQPLPQFTREILRELSPVVGLITSTLLLITLFTN